jgi:hypothetical protein
VSGKVRASPNGRDLHTLSVLVEGCSIADALKRTIPEASFMRARLNQGCSLADSDSDPFQHEEEDPVQELEWGKL